jgi:hypothetical protein
MVTPRKPGDSQWDNNLILISTGTEKGVRVNNHTTFALQEQQNKQITRIERLAFFRINHLSLNSSSLHKN